MMLSRTVTLMVQSNLYSYIFLGTLPPLSFASLCVEGSITGASIRLPSADITGTATYP